MNFTIDLIMVGIFLRLANIRSFGGFDIFPDFVGALLILLAIIVGKKYSGEIRQATIPATLYTVLSLGSFYNYLSEESTAVHMGIYIAWQAALALVEIWMYSKLMYACCEIYDETLSGADKGALTAYVGSLIVGTVISFMVWKTVTVPSSTEPFATWTVIYYAYILIHIVITVYLLYRFYIKKPKFR